MIIDDDIDVSDALCLVTMRVIHSVGRQQAKKRNLVVSL